MADSKYKLALQIVGMVDQSLGQACNLTKKQMRDLAKAAAQASGQSVSMTKAFQDAGPGIDKMWGGLTKAAGTAINAMKVAAGATAALGAASISVGSDFESAMSSWAATSQATQAQYEAAKQAAMEMGRSTSKTASESANALEYMALAGWSVEDSIKALPSVLRLSEATGLDLARTSDLVTDSMSAAGIAIDDLSGYLDVAATANNKSNQTAEMLMEAYIGVGGVLNNLKVPIEDSATVLGILANRGIKGSEAGNALNAVMANLTAGMGQAGKEMKRLGLSAFDSEGNFKGMKEMFSDLNDVLSEMTDEERNESLAKLGGKLHVDAINDILQGLNTEVREGVTEWDELNRALNDCEGAMENMANVKMDNLQGDLAKATSALQDDAIRIYDALNEPIREAVQMGTQLIYDFGDAIENGLTEALPTVRRELLEGKDALTEFTSPLIATTKFLVENGDKVVGTIVGIGTAITTLKVASEITAGLAGIKGFILAMASNPVTAAIGGVALLGGAIAGIATQEAIAARKAKNANLAQHFGDITLSLQDLKDISTDIIGAELIENLSEQMEELAKLDTIADKLSDASKKIDRITWKVKAGFTLTESDGAELKDSIDTMVSQSLAAVEQAKYTAHISVKALFGEGNENGQELLEELNGLYDGMYTEVTELGNQLGKAYSDAMEDGIVDMDEAKVIRELQEKLATITNEVTQAQTEAKLERIKLKYSGENLTADSYKNLQQEINENIEEQAQNYNAGYDFLLGGITYDKNQGNISRATYERKKEIMDEQLQQDLDALSEKSFNYSLDTVEASYRSEIDSFTEKIPGVLEEAFAKMRGGMDGIEAFASPELAQSFEVDKATQAAVRELLDGMQPQIDEMRAKAEEYKAAGKAVPESLKEGLEDVTMLEALSGDIEAMNKVLGDAIAENEEYQSALDTLEEQGAFIPKTLGDSITNHKDEVDRAARQLRIDAATALDNEFSSPFTVSADVNVNFRPISTIVSAEAIGKTGIKKHASGGIVRSPELSWIGEGGDDEGIIPINRSQRAADLFNQVGAELEAAGNTGIGGGSQTVTFAPVFNISGSADESTLRNVVADSYSQFKSYMQRFMRDERRLSY